MDPNLQAIMIAFTVGSVQSQGAQRDHHVGMLARQGDFAAQDNRMITSAILSMLISSDDPAQFAGLQTASHVPGVQPYPGPAGGAGGANAGQAGKAA